MKVFGLGVPELLIILAVILIIFGPKNLPKLGSALGKTVKNLRDGMGIDKKKKADEADEEVEGEAVIEEVVDEKTHEKATSADEPTTTVKKKVVVKKKLD